MDSLIVTYMCIIHSSQIHHTTLCDPLLVPTNATTLNMFSYYHAILFMILLFHPLCLTIYLHRHGCGSNLQGMSNSPVSISLKKMTSLCAVEIRCQQLFAERPGSMNYSPSVLEFCCDLPGVSLDPIITTVVSS